ncbi:hypothetical protein FSP39_010472 [Pinctada imbricata]|uniref:Uncharacterized protein n=1 Tax=Pinctada imbricata TaxID=66713 RepID=A0AA89BQY6_PINIB|nr:hypothetical protein FSP39_010472 [Pinctada imbricata]
MALIANRNQIGIKSVGTTVHCANVPRAKLMFYLDCICTVLELDDPDINRLKDYDNYWRLSDEEEIQLLIYCAMLSPDKLIEKCIFFDKDGDICGSGLNAFFEISAVQNRVLVTENILVGNHQRHVKQIMYFKKDFLDDYYFTPWKTLQTRLDDAQRSTRPAITYNQRSTIVPPTRYTSHSDT